MVDAFIDQNSFFWEMICLCGAFAFVFERRPNFGLRTVGLFSVGLLISQLLPVNLSVGEISSPIMAIILPSLYPRYIILFSVCLLIVWASLECSLWDAIFVTASAYCMQHIIYKSYSSLNEFVALFVSDEKTLYLVYAVSRFIISWGYFVLFWIFFVKKLEELNGFELNNKYLVILAIVIVTAANSLNAIFYALYFSYPVYETKILFLTLYALFPLLLCILCMIGLLDGTYKQTINANYIKSQALYDKMRIHYELSKKNADTINIKYHDLKRFLEKSVYSHESLDDIYRVIEQYEAIPKTSNTALNIVLSEKLTEIKNEHIEFHANINAEPLGFMSELDIYTFFSNLLTNAVEYLTTNQDAAKYIFLDIAQSGEMVRILQENGLSSTVAISPLTGLPNTTKPDKLNHGFGVKSMREIVEKYQGNILFDATGEKFTVVVLIPLPA